MLCENGREREYPTWACNDCGEKYGRRLPSVCTIHMDTCGVCGEYKPVTQPRDFGHLKDGWQHHAR